MKVSIPNIVRNLGKNVKFMQPVYESIVNSLEANATRIELEFLLSESMVEITPKITGFTIIDNGDGFDKANIDAFCELWTNNKIALGCKGSGRFTWLKVYNNILIESYVKQTQKRVIIPFSNSFDEKEIIFEDANISENKTIISFSNITDAYYFNGVQSRRVDHRADADLNSIVNEIKEYLLLKLFLLKKSGKLFEIIVKVGNDEARINNDSVPDVDKVSFKMESEVTNEEFEFDLYYKFFKDNRNSKRLYFCSNYRAIMQLDGDDLGFSAGLPDSGSFTMFLCSAYLNDKDNDARNEFSALVGMKQANLSVPLLISDIKAEAKKYVQRIILVEYPTLEEHNKQEEAIAIEKAPYLSSIIKRNNDILKSSTALIKDATREFNNQKIDVAQKFEKLLNDRNIDSQEYNESVSTLSEMAALELGEYIFYRDNIIKALSRAVKDGNELEKYYHDIFMPMKTIANESQEDKHLLSNIWLLDDKFMTYSYAASDKTIKQIVEMISAKDTVKYKYNNRPDLAVFYNRQNGAKDIVMVEFKGPNATIDEKNKSLTELPNDIAIVKKNINDIKTTWSYIITTIDEDFAFSIDNTESYTRLFTTSDKYKAYYRYFQKAKAHVFVVDINAILDDAMSRNQTFLDILKKGV